jgi:hypothetical protein
MMEHYSSTKIKKNSQLFNMDEPWKHYCIWKDLVTEDSILDDSVYMKCQNKQIYKDG